jgi:hypothetical protein
MATNTTRLGLIKPDYVDDVDIADINSNMDDIDSAVGATICTSTTRPGSPFTGQLIFETNTDKFLVWTGSVWEESVGGAEALNDLTDVTITGSTADRVLRYNGSAWVNGQVVTNDITDANVTSVKLGAGTVLQVQQAFFNQIASTQSGTYVDVEVSGTTYLSVTITPVRTNSKFLVIANVLATNNDNNSTYVRLVRNDGTDTVIAGQSGNADGHYAMYRGSTIGTALVPLTTACLDSPTTPLPATLTYRIQYRRSGTTAYINRGSQTSTEGGSSSVTVYEIGA